MSGLMPDRDYQEKSSGKIYGGDELMEVGISVPLIKEDFHVFSFHFIRIDRERQAT